MMSNSIKNVKAQKLLLEDMFNDDNNCNRCIKSKFTDNSNDLMIGNGYFGFRLDAQNLMLDKTKFEDYPIFQVVTMNNTRDLVFSGFYDVYIEGTNKMVKVYCFITADVGIAKHYFLKKYMDLFNMEYVEYHYKQGICIITDIRTNEIIGYVMECEKVGEKE